MERPLAIIIRMLAAPKLTAIDRGVLRASMPFLKLVRNQSGTIDVRESPGTRAGPAGQWIKVIGQLLPALTRLSYDTAAGVVDLFYDATDREMWDCVEKLVTVAASSVVKFMTVDGERLNQMRAELADALEAAPIHMLDDDATERLQRLIDSL